MKKHYIKFFHPFLLGIFPILFLYSHNVAEVSFVETLLPIALVVALTALFLLVFHSIFRDYTKTAIFVSLFLIIFFAHSHVFEKIYGWQLGPFVMSRHRHLLLIWVILMGVLGLIIKRTKVDLIPLNRALNVVSAVLVVISLFNAGFYELKSRQSAEHELNSRADDFQRNPSVKPGSAPDIYYIILDGYASNSVLERFHNFNNSEFTEFLRSRGFYVAPDSKSNYYQTFLSFSSFLNMEYVNYFTELNGEKSRSRKKVYPIVKNNRILQFLKAQGYQTIHFSSGWGPTDFNHLADVNITWGKKLNEFQILLIQSTMLKPYEKCLIGDDIRGRILNVFSKIPAMVPSEGPKFILAHIVAPHPPFLFGPDGEALKNVNLTYKGAIWAEKDLYINQLIFINKKVKALVDDILAKSAKEPIIVIQADHGSHSTFPRYDLDALRYPTKEMIQEVSGILNAYYLPHEGEKILYPSITPVNSFRLIFNHYFGTQFEKLPDEGFYSTDEFPYQFKNIKDILGNYEYPAIR